jgi:ferrochelatase
MASYVPDYYGLSSFYPASYGPNYGYGYGGYNYARLLGEALGRDVDVAFQSKFGRAKWLEPATDATLAAYPRQGLKRVAVAAPGFSVDCIETLEELGIRGRHTFKHAGGEDFALLDCLNDSPESIAMLERLIGRELAGWRREE